ncbi:ABC transporter permease subunit [Nocardiopsis sp. ARC36]
MIEAGMIDGGGRLRVLVSIVLPMSRNALITAGLFTFLFAWSDFLFALTLNTTDAVKPVTLGIYEYIGAHVGDWGAVMAAAVLSSVPAAVLLVVAQRYVAAGISSGALK